MIRRHSLASECLQGATMKIKFLLSFVLTSGLALAQAGSNSAGTPLPGQSSTSQSGQGASATSSAASGQTLRGCLKQSGGSWTLSHNGQDMAVTGDNAVLKGHDGQQVEVQGTQTGSTLQVTSVTKLTDTCRGPASSSSATRPEGSTNTSPSDSNSSDQTSTSPHQSTPSTGPPNTQPTKPPQK
jgi:hypothetical protein